MVRVPFRRPVVATSVEPSFAYKRVRLKSLLPTQKTCQVLGNPEGLHDLAGLHLKHQPLLAPTPLKLFFALSATFASNALPPPSSYYSRTPTAPSSPETA